MSWRWLGLGEGGVVCVGGLANFHFAPCTHTHTHTHTYTHTHTHTHTQTHKHTRHGLAGSIKVGGVHIEDIQLESLRRAIGVVPQETTLFNESIFYNIAYGSTGASEEEVRSGGGGGSGESRLARNARALSRSLVSRLGVSMKCVLCET